MGSGRKDGAVARRGFTLIELLLVLGLLSLMLGMGLGMFATLDPGKRAAQGLVASVLRSAHNSAVVETSPARVRIDPAAGTLVAEALTVLGTWHFETRELKGAFGLDAVALGGDDRMFEPDGFQGGAVSFESQASGSRIEVAVQNNPAWSLRDGFRIDVALRMEGARAANVIDIGRCAALGVSSDGSLHAAFLPVLVKQTGESSVGGRVVLATPPGSLPLGRWTRVRVGYDRRLFTIEVEGVRVAALAESAAVWDLEGPLAISGGDRPFEGAIDSLIIAAVSAVEVVHLPETVRFVPGTPEVIQFAAGGALDPAVHDGPARLGLEFDDGQRRSLQVSLYGTVE